MTRARLILALAGAVLFCALFFGAGVSTARLLWIGGAALIVAAAAGAAVLMGLLPRPAVGRYGLLFITCFAGLVLWQGLSIVWSVQPDRSWGYVNRGIVYLAFLCIGMVIAAVVPRAPRAIAGGLSALLGLVLGYALLAKGIPALYSDYGRLARLRSPIGDWNALSLLGDMALVLGLWRGAHRKVDGVVLVFVATIATLLAYSRGGVLIGVLVAAAWLALTSKRFEALVTLALGGGAGVGVAGVSLLLHGVTHNHQSHSSRARDGLLFLLLVIVLGAVAAALARRAFRLEPTPAAQQRATFALLVLLVLGAVGGIVGVALQSGHSTNANAAGSFCVQSASRLACGSSDERLDWWKESWQSFRDQPLHGTGAGSFQLAHTLRRAHYTRPVPEPHNLALQVLGETGIVGFVLFIGAVVAAALAIRPRVRKDDAVAALAICVVAYLLHSLIDMDYDFVAVSAPLFLVLGVLLARPGPVVARREPIWALGIAAFAGAAILSLAAPYIAVQKTNAALHSTSLPRALDLLHQAHTWNPVSVDPLLTQASLEPNKLLALQLYGTAVDTQPDNPEPLIQLGLFELHDLKNACAAYRDLNHAYTLDRFNPEIAKKGGPLDVARAKVNRGACGP